MPLSDNRIHDLDVEDGYLPTEALCPVCHLTTHAGLPTCVVCKEGV